MMMHSGGTVDENEDALSEAYDKEDDVIIHAAYF